MTLEMVTSESEEEEQQEVFVSVVFSSGRTSSASRKEMWDTIVIGVNACGNHVRDKRSCHKRFDDIRSKLKKKIQHQRVHATGTGGGPTPQRLILSPLEELLRAKLLPVVVEGLPGDRDIGIYPSQFPPVAPEGHVSPETEQVSSPGSASSTHLEEHDEEDFDDDDDDDAAAAAIDTQIQASDHEEVPIETVLLPKRPANTTYDAIVASEGKIVEAENRRHSDLMTVLERMIALQEETVSQLAHLHRVFIEVPKQLQKINTSFEALVVQQTQANYWRMTNVPQFNTSQPGSVHAGQFSPHSSDIHSPGPNITGQVADIAVQVPDDILPLPSVQIQQLTPTKEATKRKHKQLLLTSFWSKTTKDTHETDQPSLVQCLPTCSHVSVGTSPVREQSLPKSPVGESLPKSPVGESLPKSPVGESLPKSPVDAADPNTWASDDDTTTYTGGGSIAKVLPQCTPSVFHNETRIAYFMDKWKSLEYLFDMTRVFMCGFGEDWNVSEIYNDVLVQEIPENLFDNVLEYRGSTTKGERYDKADLCFGKYTCYKAPLKAPQHHQSTAGGQA
ncbi:uncharacterized protein LOC142501342 [Ascaphus truei]|uniref:uncharacterized protein LOC142501342 n=1 Tax=Ascaphus truei TaxID=8439 RepID=UPI003F59A51D